MKLGFFIVLAATGCASAGKGDEIGGRPDGGGIHLLDSDMNMPPVDGSRPIDAAPQPDAPPGEQTITLDQTPGDTFLTNNSIACPATTVGTSANTYYRVFDLAAAGITGTFHVTDVKFQVEDCESVNSDGAAVAVRVGTYSGTIGGTLQKSKITITQSNNSVQVPEIESASMPAGGTVDAPIAADIDAGSKLIVEVDAPDGNNQYQFYIGTAGAGGSQTGLGYVSSPTCTPPGTTPTDVTTITSNTDIYILLTVTGTY
jgi:hypothetical protein